MAAAPEAAAILPRTFKAGSKKVFLPRHAITFLAPRPNTPPWFATFKVPMTFNKFDIRDYLYNVYNTPVLGVRSQVRQRRDIITKRDGRKARPVPVKTMTVQLMQPFVWPGMPADLTPWQEPGYTRIKKAEETQRAQQHGFQKHGIIPMRDEAPDELALSNLKKEVDRLLKDGGWSNKRELDPRFSPKGGI
ncbi:hypothetical protein F4808DRAFT_437986 [Astrocystis sublimbata]|nr:hypothetical protein F4808DRAFT_437986 [Astrocystis sublimbata]